MSVGSFVLMIGQIRVVGLLRALGFLGLEVFRNDVYLFLRLSWKRRGRWNFVDRDWDRFRGFLL